MSPHQFLRWAYRKARYMIYGYFLVEEFIEQRQKLSMVVITKKSRENIIREEHISADRFWNSLAVGKSKARTFLTKEVVERTTIKHSLKNQAWDVVGLCAMSSWRILWKRSFKIDEPNGQEKTPFVYPCQALLVASDALRFFVCLRH